MPWWWWLCAWPIAWLFAWRGWWPYRFHRHIEAAVGACCDGTPHYTVCAGSAKWVLLTHVILRCKTCGRIRSQTVPGRFTLEELNGSSAEVLAEIKYLDRRN